MKVFTIPTNNPATVSTEQLLTAIGNAHCLQDVLDDLKLLREEDWQPVFLTQTEDGEYVFRDDILDEQIDPEYAHFTPEDARWYAEKILDDFTEGELEGEVVLVLFSGFSHDFNDHCSRRDVIEGCVLTQLNLGNGVVTA
jgi:hypothetical protein